MIEEEDETHSTYSAEEQETLELRGRMRLVSDDSKKVTHRGSLHNLFGVTFLPILTQTKYSSTYICIHIHHKSIRMDTKL